MSWPPRTQKPRSSAQTHSHLACDLLTSYRLSCGQQRVNAWRACWVMHQQQLQLPICWMGGYRLYTIYTILISEKDGAVLHPKISERHQDKQSPQDKQRRKVTKSMRKTNKKPSGGKIKKTKNHESREKNSPPIIYVRRQVYKN